MHIRNATNKDLDQIFNLTKVFATSFETNKDEFSETYPDIIADKNTSLIVAEIDGHVAWYCLAFHHKTFYANGTVSWIEEIYVNDKFKGKGIGSKLIQAIEHYAKSINSKLVALATRRAADFYKKNNYKESAIYFRKLL